MAFELTPQEQTVRDKAVAYANANKKRIAKEIVDSFDAETEPVSVFMAGSPGAGKTEVSKAFIEALGGSTLRIDNDELRERFEDYEGFNSPLFQDAATRLVEAIHDCALKRRVSFILDTTLANLAKASQNIERSIRRERTVLVLFVYQRPEVAWQFVKAREKAEGRRVPPEVFIEQFIGARETVNTLKQTFGRDIELTVLVKDIKGEIERFYDNVDSVDAVIKEKYNRESLAEIVCKG